MSTRTLLLSFGVAACAAFPGCADPTHDAAVEALGGEAPGVPKGPLHRPGQPCLVCHGGEGPAESELSLAGTVYLLRDRDVPASAATVQIVDIAGASVDVPTNSAGNFYVAAKAWQPKYPIQPKLQYGSIKQRMFTHVSREGVSCADCHTSPVSPESAGHIYVATHASVFPPGTVPP